MSLLPKSDALLEELAAHATLIVEASELRGGRVDADARRAQLEALETRGDTIIVRIIESLRTTFLTPLDRDDLFNLATRQSALLSSVVTARFFEPVREATSTDGESDLDGKAVNLVAEALVALKDERARDGIRERCLAARAMERASERRRRRASPDELNQETRAAFASATVIANAARVADAILLALLDT